MSADDRSPMTDYRSLLTDYRSPSPMRGIRFSTVALSGLTGIETFVNLPRVVFTD
jgi:hypothetical protein